MIGWPVESGLIVQGYNKNVYWGTGGLELATTDVVNFSYENRIYCDATRLPWCEVE
jgi:hypothetical protein